MNQPHTPELKRISVRAGLCTGHCDACVHKEVIHRVLESMGKTTGEILSLPTIPEEILTLLRKTNDQVGETVTFGSTGCDHIDMSCFRPLPIESLHTPDSDL